MILTLALISGVIISSLSEYLLHQYYLHNSDTNPHVTWHHQQFRSDESFEHRNVRLAEVMNPPKYITVNILLCLPVGLLFAFHSINAVFLFMTTGIVYTFWVELAHLYYHKPENDGIKLESISLFNNLKENHRMHHRRHETNFGIGSTMWDHILDTKQ